MKKVLSVIALVLVLAMVMCCLTGCTKRPSKGTYKVKEATDSFSYFESLSDYITLEVGSKGEAKLKISAFGETESTSVVFEKDGTVKLDDQKCTYTVKGKTITIKSKDDSGKIVFEKQ